MEILAEEHLERLEPCLRGRRVLEVGCGDGFRTARLARFCREITGIDPNPHSIGEARELHAGGNILYEEGDIFELRPGWRRLDAVVFMLSLHHVPPGRMAEAISAAVALVEPGAPVLFVEPGWNGSFFEAERRFEACDWDERLAKALAYAAILSHPRLREVTEFFGTTRYQFDSARDYMEVFLPRRPDEGLIDAFLRPRYYLLEGERRVNVCAATR